MVEQFCLSTNISGIRLKKAAFRKSTRKEQQRGTAYHLLINLLLYQNSEKLPLGIGVP